jgi:hypothetical protein
MRVGFALPVRSVGKFIVRRDAQVFPLSVGCKNLDRVFFGCVASVTSEQEPKRGVG